LRGAAAGFSVHGRSGGSYFSLSADNRQRREKYYLYKKNRPTGRFGALEEALKLAFWFCFSIGIFYRPKICLSSGSDKSNNSMVLLAGQKSLSGGPCPLDPIRTRQKKSFFLGRRAHRYRSRPGDPN